MKHVYTAFIINKHTKQVIKRFWYQTHTKYLWKKELEKKINEFLAHKIDLERKDLIVKEYEGTIDNYDE